MSELKIHCVAACSKNWGIGKNGTLPWHLPKEYKYFAAITTGAPPTGKQNVVIMGRKTWESIPTAHKPLRNRVNVVFSRNMVKPSEGPAPHAVVSSLDELVEFLEGEWKEKVHEVFNVGGHDIYKLVLNSSFCGKVYLTKILKDYDCDTFFPKLESDFKLLPSSEFEIPQGIQKDKGIEWKVDVYAKQ